MNAPAKSAAKRRLLLASDRSDESTELASILKAVGDVSTVTTQDIPEQPSRDLSGLVVDINLRSPESVQLVRNKLRGEAYRTMPRLFVLADALHHGTDAGLGTRRHRHDLAAVRRPRQSCSASAPRSPTPTLTTRPIAARRSTAASRRRMRCW